MTTEAAGSTPAKVAPAAPPQLSTHPYIGILGVFLGAGVATMNSRLVSIGLPDLRGANGFGFDEASWIPTVLDMALMFSGVFCVFLNTRFGPRRILLPCAAVFTIVSLLLPFSPNLWVMLFLQAIAGLSSGTFYSLTLTFALTALPKRLVIWGISAYAADIVFSSNIAEALQGWFAEHLSWHWIFWNAAIFTPVMFLCVYLGIPRRGLPPERGPSWLGFTYFSLGLALLVGAFDQGERLYWMHSGVIVGMFVSGAFLLVVTCIIRGRQANPLANLAFLNTRNIIILATSIFLGNIQGFRALQTGQTLAWVALPQFLATRRTNRNTKIVWLVALAIIHTNSRLVMAVGFTAIGAARSAAVLNGQVRVQALSLAYSDAFLLIGWGIAAYLLLIVCMRPSSINLRSKEKTV